MHDDDAPQAVSPSTRTRGLGIQKLSHQKVIASWRFGGEGQTKKEEETEIKIAAALGLTERYEEERKLRPEPEPGGRRRRTPRGDAAVPGDGTSAFYPLLVKNLDDCELRDLVDAAARGLIEPEPIPTPVGLPTAAQTLAGRIAWLAGLRLAIGDARPLPVSQSLAGLLLGGVSKVMGWRALRCLEKSGWLRPAGELSARGGLGGLRLYDVAGLTPAAPVPSASDGVPEPVVEGATVAVETPGTESAGLAVEPCRVAADQTGVSDAVAPGSESTTDTLDCVTTPRDGADGNGGASHVKERYRPTLAALVAHEKGGREGTAAAWWFACQARDHGYPEHEAGLAVTEIPGVSVTKGINAVSKAYATKPRPPWSPMGSADESPREPAHQAEADTSGQVSEAEPVLLVDGEDRDPAGPGALDEADKLPDVGQMGLTETVSSDGIADASGGSAEAAQRSSHAPETATDGGLRDPYWEDFPVDEANPYSVANLTIEEAASVWNSDRGLDGQASDGGEAWTAEEQAAAELWDSP